MTLREIIARYESAQAEEQAKPINARTSALTPLGHAAVAANRLAVALKPLTAEERLAVLVTMLDSIEAGAGGTYALMISHPPVRDPQLA